MNRREFLEAIAVAAAAGLPVGSVSAQGAAADASFYDGALKPFGNVGLLHFTDCHAQLLPIHFREPNVNLGVGAAAGKPPHLVGEYLLKHFGIAPGTREAHAFTYLDFTNAARAFGQVGGFAHLATLVAKLKAARPGALLLDGGDTWQGSGTSLWTKGQDMVDAQKQLGVDVMTGHWEFTYGAARVKEIVERDFAGKVDFVAQNVKTTDFGDPVFKPYVIRQVNGVPVAIIGQAFPYTPIANPRYFVSEWTFGVQEEEMQKAVDEARAKGAQVVVVLSHNGMDVDLKMASRVTGIDAILGGHTHDGVPQPTLVANRGGKTLVGNAGSNGKFLAVLDLDVKGGKVADFRYRLLPVFSALLPADPAMGALIAKVRAPFTAKLDETLATTEGLLYRRGNFNGTSDQLILEALMAEKNAEIAFSPGFRWGTTLLPGQAIRMEHLMDQTAITYPYVTRERTHRRDDQVDPRGRRRQPVQSGPVLPAGRRHGARGRDEVHDRSARGDRRAHLADGTRRQADRRREEVQGRGLGAGVRGGEERRRRGDLGRRRALSARAEDDTAAHAQPADDRGHGGQSGHGGMTPGRIAAR